MYYCPWCKAELPAGTHFCNSCGFDQTNAKILMAASNQAKQIFGQAMQTSAGNWSSFQVSTSSERIIATSKAAESWRESWRNRQRAEGGPAARVSRGQASVPEPLLLMQDSILRMHAISLPESQKQCRSRDLGFWILIITMVCLIVALGAYVLLNISS